MTNSQNTRPLCNASNRELRTHYLLCQQGSRPPAGWIGIEIQLIFGSPDQLRLAGSNFIVQSTSERREGMGVACFRAHHTFAVI